jgi:ubiquinone/menaquinone biosynthesis C-methylase UbiE
MLDQLHVFQKGLQDEGRWESGLLWTCGEDGTFPVIKGIPIFSPPPSQTWPPIMIQQMKNEKWIQKSWEHVTTEISREVKSKITECAKRQAESNELILDIASGPGGGFTSRVLGYNPDASLLMNDLGLGVLLEWREFLREKGITRSSFALFDATNMPVCTDSLDIISDLGGLDNIRNSINAVKESYRVLKPGGTIFSINSAVVKEDYEKLPADVRKRLYSTNPPFFDGFSQVFPDVGLDIVSHEYLSTRELAPNEGDLPREAEKHGVMLKVESYYTEAKKPQ